MSYLARGYGVVRFHPHRLNKGLIMDEFYFKNIIAIRAEYAKSHKNMRWFAHYHMPVIRYWNPGMDLSVQHSKSKDTEPRIIMTFASKSPSNANADGQEESDEKTTTQTLKAYNFAHDELFEQLMEVESGANAEQLQNSLKDKRETAKHVSAQTQSA